MNPRIAMDKEADLNENHLPKRESAWIDEKGLIHYEETVNVTPIHQENWNRQQDERKGFSPDRSLQHIARVPPMVYHFWAKRIGFYAMDKQQKKAAKLRFLNEHPEYRTVKRLKTPTPSSGHIIVVQK